MAITGDNQWEFRGLLMGDGTPFGVVRFTHHQVPIRRNPLPRPTGHGVILPGADFLGAREVLFIIEVEGDTREELQTNLDALATATHPDPDGDDEPLRYQLLGETRRINCRPEPEDWEWNLEADVGLLVQNTAVRFYAQDPTIYSDAETSTVLA